MTHGRKESFRRGHNRFGTATAADHKAAETKKPAPACSPSEHFQFKTLRISNHTACRFAEKTRFFRSRWAGRRRAAASRFTFFKVETL